MIDPALHNSLESIRKDLLERYTEGNVQLSNTTSKTNDLAPHDTHTQSFRRPAKTMSPLVRWFVRVFLRPNHHDISGGSAFYRMSSRQQTPVGSVISNERAQRITTTGITPPVSAIVDVESDDEDFGNGLPRWATGYDARVAAYESMTRNLWLLFKTRGITSVFLCAKSP